MATLGRDIQAFLRSTWPLVPLLFAGGGLGLILFAVNRYFNSLDVGKQWKETTGRITQSALTSREVRSKGARGGSVTYFGLDIAYQYTVDGQQYVGRNIHYGENSTLFQSTVSQTVEDEAAKYPAGTDVPVYYNPNKPQQAALNLSLRPGSVGGSVILGLIIIGFAVFVAFVTR